MRKRREDIIRGKLKADHQRDAEVSEELRRARLPILREVLRQRRARKAHEIKLAADIPPECRPDFEPRDAQMAGRDVRKRSEKLNAEQLARIPELMANAYKDRAYDRKFTPEKIAKMNAAVDRHTQCVQKIKRRHYLEKRAKHAKKLSATAKKYVSGGFG